MTEIVVERLKIVLVEKIKKTRGKNKDVVKVIKEMKKVGVRNLRGNKWEIEEELVLKKGKVYVLKNKKLRVEIIWLYHDVLVAGHKGR